LSFYQNWHDNQDKSQPELCAPFALAFLIFKIVKGGPEKGLSQQEQQAKIAEIYAPSDTN